MHYGNRGVSAGTIWFRELLGFGRLSIRLIRFRIGFPGYTVIYSTDKCGHIISIK